MHSIEQRTQVVEAFARELKKLFPQTNQYNVLIFGSFLTERFTEASDIDIGSFSLNSYKYAATDYCPEELITYIRKMIDLFGTNPMDTIRKKIVEEVGLNDNNW